MREDASRSAPQFVPQDVDAYAKCGRLERGFLRVGCEQCQAETAELMLVRGEAYRAISQHPLSKAGSHTLAARRAR